MTPPPFACSAHYVRVARIALGLAAYFIVARRRKACPLPPPQHGGARSGIRLFRSLRSLHADRAWVAAYFIVARRRKACPLPPPQHGGAAIRHAIVPLTPFAPRGSR